jgi:hypothetical protein
MWLGAGMSVAFSQFRKRQATFQIRYEPAYALWDNAGSVWTEIFSIFKSAQLRQAAPNKVSFEGDERFIMEVNLDSASITDHRPDASWDRTLEVFDSFYRVVVEMLRIRELTRIGTRFILDIPYSSLDIAKMKSKEFGWSSVPQQSLFRIEANTYGVQYKLEADDGELGYIAQVYPKEDTAEINPGPEVQTYGFIREKKSKPALVLDLDFMTKKKMRVDAFDADAWNEGWRKTMSKDADKFLGLRV